MRCIIFENHARALQLHGLEKIYAWSWLDTVYLLSSG